MKHYNTRKPSGSPTHSRVDNRTEEEVYADNAAVFARIYAKQNKANADAERTVNETYRRMENSIINRLGNKGY